MFLDYINISIGFKSIKSWVDFSEIINIFRITVSSSFVEFEKLFERNLKLS